VAQVNLCTDSSKDGGCNRCMWQRLRFFAGLFPHRLHTAVPLLLQYHHQYSRLTAS
jgi:hypothetical protein